MLALDAQAAAELAAQSQITLAHNPDDLPMGPFDAIAGSAAPEQVAALSNRLRPGGRLILTHVAEPEALLAALANIGLVHCLVEPHGPFSLYRGEQPAGLEAVARPAGGVARGHSFDRGRGSTGSVGV